MRGPGTVDADEIVDGYQISKGHYVLLDVADYGRFISRGVLAHPSRANAARNSR